MVFDLDDCGADTVSYFKENEDDFVDFEEIEEDPANWNESHDSRLHRQLNRQSRKSFKSWQFVCKQHQNVEKPAKNGKAISVYLMDPIFQCIAQVGTMTESHKTHGYIANLTGSLENHSKVDNLFLNNTEMLKNQLRMEKLFQFT